MSGKQLGYVGADGKIVWLNPTASDELPVGTRIRFPRTLDAPADEESPARVYAYAGEEGVIAGGRTRCGNEYWVKTNSWPTKFGATIDEFQVVKDTPDA